jgi:hypothetical protein
LLRGSAFQTLEEIKSTRVKTTKIHLFGIMYQFFYVKNANVSQCLTKPYAMEMNEGKSSV